MISKDKARIVLALYEAVERLETKRLKVGRSIRTQIAFTTPTGEVVDIRSGDNDSPDLHNALITAVSIYLDRSITIKKEQLKKQGAEV